MLGHRVQRLVQNTRGEIVGVEATTRDGQPVAVRARRAVIFGSGGFTHNRELMLSFRRGPEYGGCAVPTNEGDFIYAAGALGAKLGNMSNGFRAEIVLEHGLQFSSTPSDVWFIIGDSVVEVNRYGRRFMDEKRNYHDRSATHFAWDPATHEWPNLLLFMIYDQRTADYWTGFYPLPDSAATAPYVLSGNTLDELSRAIEGRLTELAPRIGGFNLDSSFAANLPQTITRFNDAAKHGVDPDFRRGEWDYDKEQSTRAPTLAGAQWPSPDQVNPSMYPFRSTGPYYAIIIAAGTLDTNGGPVINERSQVVNQDGVPLGGLYGAGNCIASPAGGAYWGAGGTLGPAVTFGYIAGVNAARESIKEV
jgi:succinate dehydrogenase/fumarate reductase flavoprotein subunit